MNNNINIGIMSHFNLDKCFGIIEALFCLLHKT